MSASTPSATALPANPTTPVYSDDVEWITAYLTIHMMSDPSRRYTYLLWVVVALVFLAFGLLHWTGSRGGYFGAYWTKWALRRRSWGKKRNMGMKKGGEGHSQPIYFPSNAQLLALGVLLIFPLALSCVGPDYIAPNLKLWEFYGPNATTTTTTTTARRAYDTSVWTQYQPQYTIAKAWWTAGSRTGLIAFALFPMCILFALKAPPFAVFAIPFMIQLHFDKLAWLHRWSGRLIWLLSAAHVALWSVQLARETRPATGQIVYTYAWKYEKFIYGWIAFGLLTLLMVFSILPLRRSYYETFYFLHVLLVPSTLFMAALHHPPVWWWCWAALGLWAGERLWRATWWLHTNGFFGGIVPSAPILREDKIRAPQRPQGRNTKGENWELNTSSGLHQESLSSQATLIDSPAFPLPKPGPYAITPFPPHIRSPLSPGTGSHSPYSPHNVPPPRAWSPQHTSFPSTSSSQGLLSPTADDLVLPPPGYVHAELLSGRSVRLRFITPGFLSWAPGQHFLISIPSVSKVTSHPFTVASVCDEQAPNDAGRELEFIVRAKQGWTKDLWDKIITLTAHGQSTVPGEKPPKGTVMPSHGVLMRMYVDGPFGSAVRARWGNYSTMVIIAGGSGVSFGLSVLQYMCMCLAGRDGKFLGGRPGGWGKKGFLTNRIRFVWIVREFSHIQWCASILRRCMALIPPPGLEINIFVTNFKPLKPPPRRGRSPPPVRLSDIVQDDHLAPPQPGFASSSRRHSRSSSIDSMESRDDSAGDVDSLVDLSYYTGHYGEDEEAGDLGAARQNSLLDLTNFDGDDDTSLPGEDALNLTVRKAGKLRRAKTKRAERAAKHGADAHTALLQNHGGGPSRGNGPQHISGKPLVDAPSPLSSRHHRQQSSVVEVDLGNPLTPATPSAQDKPWHMQYPPRSPLSPMETPRSPLEGLQSPISPFASADPSADGFRSPSVLSHAKSDASSIRELIPQVGTGAHGERVQLDLDERELRDIHIVAEHARPGRPRLEKILYDEVQASRGETVVTCCGPTSLNALVRKAISAQIDPARLRRGDPRGSIALVSEEFEY
ncbi:hypothetical protein PLICRDRAFT_41633 [Plicaturopsis crispa FD-325 SS-3]|nr:hypothetical protein PLICRDRAFT_41633 [Plicaturopsis crispa FD-325 SS-3]